MDKRRKYEFNDHSGTPAGDNTGDFYLLKSLEFKRFTSSLEKVEEPVPVFGIAFDQKKINSFSFAYKMRQMADGKAKVDIYARKSLEDVTEFELLYSLDLGEKYYFQLLYSKEGKMIYSVSKILNGELTLLTLRLYYLSTGFKTSFCREC